MVNQSLKNKKIIVSAGASGIGLATTKVCLSRGAYVYLCDIDNKSLNKLNKHPLINKRLFKYNCDASDESQVLDLFKKINKSTEEFENKFWNSKSAETFYNNLPATTEDPMALLFRDAMQNLLKRRSKTDLNTRMTTLLETGIEKQMSKISKGFTFLATIGSTAPFIGLFGTVWGIMNSFQSIAISRNTSLAIVAPGIAEALFATALGLLAAIPAVVAYNKFNNDSIKYSQKLENFSRRFLTII